MLTAPAQTYDRLWSPVLETVRADALDCIQANLAVLADHAHGPGAHLELGATLAFDVEPGPNGGPRVARSVPYRLAAAHDLLGLRVVDRWDDVDGARLRALAVDAGPLLVVADAYGLAWTPYAGRQHVEHTFVLPAPDTVVDGYHDETPWGAQRPGVWRVAPAQLDAMVASATALSFAVEPVASVPSVLAANARAMLAAGPAIDTYLSASRAGSELVLDIWLLGRSRLLHAAWLARHGEPATDMAEQAQAWLALAARAYVAVRRDTATGVLDEVRRLLREDAVIASRLAATRHRTAPDREAVRNAVLAAIREVLRIDDNAIRSAATLRQLPGYNSFRLVDIVEHVEIRLDVAFDDRYLTAQALVDVDSLCTAFAQLAA